MQQYHDTVYTSLHFKSLFLPAKTLLVLGFFSDEKGGGKYLKGYFFPEHFTFINTFSLQVIMRRIYFIVFLK